MKFRKPTSDELFILQAKIYRFAKENNLQVTYGGTMIYTLEVPQLLIGEDENEIKKK